MDKKPRVIREAQQIVADELENGVIVAPGEAGTWDFATLLADWASRDKLYERMLARSLDEQAIQSARDYRKREAGILLKPEDRGRGWARANSWVPPFQS